MKMTAYKTYEEAKANFTWDQVWENFDGDKSQFNVAHECIDRHAGKGTAFRIKFADGHTEKYSFDEISALTSRFANGLEELGVDFGDKVAIMLDPCLEFYVSLFGTLKRGAVVVPCFTLFGPEALQHRLQDSGTKLLIITEEMVPLVGDVPVPHIITVGSAFDRWIKNQATDYTRSWETAGNDVGVIQYTSGTTRKFPEGIDHFHKSVALLVPSGVFAMGLKPGDHFFCPSSPAWGNGLWYGTFTPLTLGIGVGALSGKFDERTLLEALEEFEINNLHAAPTVFRRLIKTGLIEEFNLKLDKLSYAGETMDLDTFDYLQNKFGVSPCSLYGSTEVGCIIVHFGGFDNWTVKPGSMGKPLPGLDIRVVDKEGNDVPANTVGEIVMNRRGKLFPVKDSAIIDEDGYFWHKGRSDDVIISAGWTISPTEVETSLLNHKEILEAAVVGIPDAERGHIVKAFLRVTQERPGLEQEIKDYIKTNLSKHEYPRAIEFVDEFPKTPKGNIIKKALLEKAEDKG